MFKRFLSVTLLSTVVFVGAATSINQTEKNNINQLLVSNTNYQKWKENEAESLLKTAQQQIGTEYKKWKRGKGNYNIINDYSLANNFAIKEELKNYWTEVRTFFQQLKKEFGALDVLEVGNANKPAKQFQVLELVEQSDKKINEEFSNKFLSQLHQFYWHDQIKKDKWTLLELQAILTKVKATPRLQLQKWTDVLKKTEYRKILTSMELAKDWTLVIGGYYFSLQGLASLIINNQEQKLQVSSENAVVVLALNKMFAFLLGGLKVSDLETALANNLQARKWWADFQTAWKKRIKLNYSLVGVDFFPLKNSNKFTLSMVDTFREEINKTNFQELKTSLQARIAYFVNSAVSVNYYFGEVIDRWNESSITQTKTPSLAVGLATVGGMVGISAIIGLFYWIIKTRR